jgi:hypothetical protein
VTLFGILPDARVTVPCLRWGGGGGREAAEDECARGAFARRLWRASGFVAALVGASRGWTLPP